MSSQHKSVQQELKPIYQCDSKVHHTLQSVKDHLHQLCANHAHRLVKVETMDGDVFEGHIVHCDRSILYICLSNEGARRGFFPSPGFPPQQQTYSNVILPLVLFNLLAISLL